ncbi:gamma-glutamylcyclotransferase [Jiella sp. MQZ9-1]|uniref:Gamma-glutamylcyclotransferase n=1 Tax=Jiella flava TaxID=2816857 RepID=A0A939JSV6_9HYPH|nr:gamma-glutamylcyclotransferase family protein [Jiella flava]MBO0661490.1 gamma-glutamylcyclotransferase [Jiella flava]MCD2470132.1 gamma-glutamylcyclotransferase [Jiella flava]
MPHPALHEDHPDLAALAAEGRVVAYFGYGSLVNPRTLRTKFLAIRRAEAAGWRRVWLPREADAAMSLLSVKRDEAAAVHGVVVYDLVDHLPSVDEREAGYARRIVDHDRLTVENPPLADIPVYLYEAHSCAVSAEERQSAILQSYLDAVMQGFLMLYGEAGVDRFVAETHGFETRLLTDRILPRYPRPVTLDAGEAALFDSLVTARGLIPVSA